MYSMSLLAPRFPSRVLHNELRSVSQLVLANQWFRASHHSIPAATIGSQRAFSSGFRFRRRPDKKYRPIKPVKPKKASPMKKQLSVSLGDVPNPVDDLEETFGPLAADVIRQTRQEASLAKYGEDAAEQELRLANYLTSEVGSIDELIMERKGLAMEIPNVEERKKFMENLEAKLEERKNFLLGLEGQDEKARNLEIKEDYGDEDEDEDNMHGEETDPDVHLDKNQLAHGEWSEMLIKVDRNIKLWRGGRLESYRALVIGGNMNGCGGFGIGKSKDPLLAVSIAGRICKRNIFFVEPYQGDGITRDLVGKQNSCKVFIRATDNGLRGNPLVGEILKRFGIVNAVSKAHGNRNPYNVVQATFKALMTHESLEDIALKRGKRLISMDRAMRMQI